MKNVKTICYLGIGIALYVAFSMSMNIPLISHIQTDLGYIVFGVWCVLFGWQGFIVGAAGCIIKTLIMGGWFPWGWFLGQIAIGIICGVGYNKVKSNIVKVIITIIAIFVGIAGIKTIVECKLYSIPFDVKIIKNLVATVADIIPMVIGMFLGNTLKERLHIN